MHALQKHLSKVFASEPEWKRVEAELRSGKTLEQALEGTGASLAPATKAKFQKVTGDFVASIDRSYRDRLLTGQVQWVGTRLVRTLIGRLPPRNPRLSIITSNYDMLIEYACSAHGLRWTTGFVGGLLRTWDWEAAQDSMLKFRTDREGSRNGLLANRLPRVELFKVHGSINRFAMENRQVECDLWTENPPDGVERELAVPGGLKFEQVVTGNMDIMSHAAQAQVEAQAFLVVGYGFNDLHLHRKLLARVQERNCPLVVLTQDLDPTRITELRKDCEHVWVLAAPRQDGGGNDNSSTVVYMPGQASPVTLKDERLWDCDEFTAKILGG